MSNVEVLVQKQLDYYNAHDLSGFLSTYSDTIVIKDLVTDMVIMEGKEAMAVRYKERFQVSKVHARLENRMVIGNKVIDHEFVAMADKGEIVKAIAIYEVKDQLIQKVWFLHA